MEQNINNNARLSMRQKFANDKQWFKEKADSYDREHNTLYYAFSDSVSDFKRMKVAYDICNNVLDMTELDYIVKPFGHGMGELPARMENRDIISEKVKAVQGMAAKRAFPYSIIATNSEATTRKEQKEYALIKQYAVAETLKEIETNLEIKYQEQLKKKNLTPQEKQEIQQQIEQDRKTMTPPEIEKYMSREYQDPSEVAASQILEYLWQKESIQDKFDLALEHGLKSARQIGYVGIEHGNPVLKVVNPMRFNFEKSTDNMFIEESEWCTYEYRMTPSEVVKTFSSELTNEDIDTIVESYGKQIQSEDIMMNFATSYDKDESIHIKVLHICWKALRELRFLSYLDKETQELKQMIVSETYKLNPELGDITIEKEWIPEVYETWKIGKDIYKRMQPVPGQFKDMDNLYSCHLPYYGVIYDNLNSVETSLVGRLLPYQLYYNAIVYKLQLLMASDKGKKVLMNINAIPSSNDFNLKKWQYYAESTSILWYDSTEEGVDASQGAGSIAKDVDLSLANDISRYINIAEYIRTQAGRSVGVTDTVEGSVGANEAVGNTQQNLVQTSNILEPYFALNNVFKKNILQALLDKAKVAYASEDTLKLAYVLDDLTRKVISIEPGTLDNDTLGIFVSNTSNVEETRQLIKTHAFASLQNQKLELSDVLSVIRQKGIVEAEETLKAAENRRREYENQAQQSKQQSEQERLKMTQQHDIEMFDRDKELIILKEEERRKTVLAQGAMMAASYNPDVDKNNNGINDFVELADKEANLRLKSSKQRLDEQKFEHQKKMDKEYVTIDKEKTNKKV